MFPWLRGSEVIAVAGIAHPAKFHATLRGLGAVVAEHYDFADHHQLSEKEATAILEAARHSGRPVVITEKDLVRLPATGARGRLREAARVVAIHLQVEPLKALRRLLGGAARLGG